MSQGNTGKDGNPAQALCIPSIPSDALYPEGQQAGWGCRRGSPAVSEGPKGPGRASCGCVGDRHSSVALWVKIAQREVGSFHMNKACF